MADSGRDNNDISLLQPISITANQVLCTAGISAVQNLIKGMAVEGYI